jgi:hypothetical protein
MGEVYRARDARLQRDVALKVLPAAFANDSQRMARFEREARMLAALNHPNIAAIYGLEDSEAIHQGGSQIQPAPVYQGGLQVQPGPVRALVMELVEGPTLADRIRNGAIPVDEVLPLAKQIAEAVEYAHEQNVIHRDLKPANIKVKEDGTVKVLDFGLAKAMSDEIADADMSNSPTLSMAATRAGIILGTAAYMSPEQARGKRVDKRTDIWAFGVVLYEMLTGERAFEGEDVSLALASVMKSDPDWNRLPKGLPLAIRNVLQRCLEKDPKRRVRDMGDVRLAMEGVFETAASRSSVGRGLRPLIGRVRRELGFVHLTQGFRPGLGLWRPYGAGRKAGQNPHPLQVRQRVRHPRKGKACLRRYGNGMRHRPREKRDSSGQTAALGKTALEQHPHSLQIRQRMRHPKDPKAVCRRKGAKDEKSLVIASRRCRDDGALRNGAATGGAISHHGHTNWKGSVQLPGGLSDAVGQNRNPGDGKDLAESVCLAWFARA